MHTWRDSYSRDSTHRNIVKDTFSRSMDHSTHACGMTKRSIPSGERYIPHPEHSSTMPPRQTISYSVYHYPKAVKMADDALESRSPHRHIDKSHYWKPPHHPPSPPQEEAAMKSLPSFSTLSNIAGIGVGNHDHKTSIQSLNKSKSLETFHYPPTPPLSLSSNSLPGRSSSPLSAPRAFLEPPTQAPAPTPMYYFTGANPETKPPLLHLQSSAVTAELERVEPFSKRHCVRSSPEASQPNYYSNQRSQANQLRRPQQPPPASPDASYSATMSSALEPINPFYKATASPIGYEHHHYISPSSASYPLQQERYNCSDCGRAFSRPSSLKIHTYSHTGEKPFYCPVRGCNKNFSVRSNMKRHERGCHARKM